jgi:hypothetical protein
MNQSLPELIDECARLHHEVTLLTPIILSLSPSLNLDRIPVNTIPKASRERFKREMDRLPDIEKFKSEYALGAKTLSLKLSDIAERLEEYDFEIERLRSQLSEDRLSWIQSHKKDLKNHLKGIEV